jgi:hypothetical protein
LSSGAEVVEIVTLLTEAKGNTDFLVSDSRAIRRKRRIEVPLVMRGPALDGDLEQPLGQPLACATQPRQLDGQA